jgi:hypothetical protein
LPIFARLNSSDLFKPSKTTLLGVINKLPWAVAFESKECKNYKDW